MKRYIKSSKEITYNKKLGTTPWSAEEEARTQECSKRIYDMREDLGWDDTDEDGDAVEVYTFDLPNRKETEVTISKCYLQKVGHRYNGETYTRIPYTTFYTVDDYGMIIDENVVGYATLADARHAAMLYIADEIRKYSK